MMEDLRDYGDDPAAQDEAEYLANMEDMQAGWDDMPDVEFSAFYTEHGYELGDCCNMNLRDMPNNEVPF